jgi:hypothetical protein
MTLSPSALGEGRPPVDRRPAPVQIPRPQPNHGYPAANAAGYRPIGRVAWICPVDVVNVALP